MKTIEEIRARIKELELRYQEVRGGKGTSELTNDERNKIIAISEAIENDEEEMYKIFSTKGRVILYGRSTCVFMLDDGKDKYMATLNDEFGTIISYRTITDEQYNAFVSN
jgi:hypothetical protein